MRTIGLITLLAGILLVSSVAVGRVAHADQPLACAPEDRVIAGNTNSDCKWDYRLDDIVQVRFVALELQGANSCYGALEFSPYNYIRDLAPKLEGERSLLPIDLGRIDSSTGEVGVSSRRVVRLEGDDSTLRLLSRKYTLKDALSDKFNLTSNTSYSTLGNASHIRLGLGPGSPWFTVPTEVNDFPVMINACLAGVKLRLETEAQKEEDRAKLAAQELARQQALAEEKAKAELDAQRLAAAQEALRIQQEIELTKTRSLIARLERDKIILGVWDEIVLERLRGFRERSDITNRYLAEIEAGAATFNTKVRNKYEELQRLEALNQAIADAIAAHNREIDAQLAAAAELEAKNMEKLEGLQVAPATPTPAEN